jgi:hypothetical protein
MCQDQWMDLHRVAYKFPIHAAFHTQQKYTYYDTAVSNGPHSQYIVLEDGYRISLRNAVNFTILIC